MITAEMVKQLRDKTGGGMMDCKRALQDADGDMEKAAKILREHGLAAAGKRAGKVAAEGAVGSYIHMGGKIGVLVEVNCETDFVAQTDKFQEFVKDISMHIAASSPEYIEAEDVPTAAIEKEKEILRAQALNEGKPEKIVDKMVEGRIKKYYNEVCLMEQPFVKDPDKTVREVLKEIIFAVGENVTIRRFTRYERGEGIEKEEANFAEEVMSEAKGK
jgi:elongation factor Ts